MRANGVAAEERDQPVGRVRAVGRVGEGDVVRAGVEPLGEPQRVAAVDRGPVADAEGVDVGPERLERRRARAPRRWRASAPRESASRPSAPLPAKRSSTRAPGSSGAEDAHPRLAHPVGGGPHAARRAAPRAAGRRTRRRRCASARRRRVILSAAKEPYPGSCPLRCAQGDRRCGRTATPAPCGADARRAAPGA